MMEILFKLEQPGEKKYKNPIRLKKGDNVKIIVTECGIFEGKIKDLSHEFITIASAEVMDICHPPRIVVHSHIFSKTEFTFENREIHGIELLTV